MALKQEGRAVVWVGEDGQRGTCIRQIFMRALKTPPEPGGASFCNNKAFFLISAGSRCCRNVSRGEKVAVFICLTAPEGLDPVPKAALPPDAAAARPSMCRGVPAAAEEQPGTAAPA